MTARVRRREILRFWCSKSAARATGITAGVIALVCVAAALGASSRVTTPISCGLVRGAPWTVELRSASRSPSGKGYYVYETANLSCTAVSKRVARLSRMTPTALRRFSVLVSTGERLHCMTVAPAKEIKSVVPRAAWGWCGTDVHRVARLGVQAAAGTEFFWVTADKPRGY